MGAHWKDVLAFSCRSQQHFLHSELDTEGDKLRLAPSSVVRGLGTLHRSSTSSATLAMLPAPDNNRKAMKETSVKGCMNTRLFQGLI